MQIYAERPQTTGTGVDKIILADWRRTGTISGNQPAGLAMGMTINGQAITQVAAGRGWIDVEIYNRSNEQNTIRFSSSTVFSTSALAADDILKKRAKCRGRWNVFFNYNPTTATKVWLKNAVINPISLRQIGCDSIIEWEIIGGRFRESTSDQD